MKIPNQLKSYGFCRVLYKKKKPYEEDWTNRPYSYEEIHKFIPVENYGVITGILRIFDDDSKDNRLIKIFLENFGETFRVRDHLYFEFTGQETKKITFYDENNKKIGEVQGKGQMCVGAGSMHPSGEIYDVRIDKPIIKIDYDKFCEVFKDYLKKPKVYTRAKINWEGDDINNIPITNIFPADLDKCPSCGCETGTNFKVYPETNSYVCFHEWSGGSIWEAIAISERIKSCSQIGKSCLSESESKEILKIAVDKYGLKLPERDNPKYKPVGWALSINIKKMAERRNMLRCNSCCQKFVFNERLGWYKCGCSKGNLKKFAALCMQESLK